MSRDDDLRCNDSRECNSRECLERVTRDIDLRERFEKMNRGSDERYND